MHNSSFALKKKLSRPPSWRWGQEELEGKEDRHRAAVSGPIQEQGEGKEKAMWV